MAFGTIGKENLLIRNETVRRNIRDFEAADATLLDPNTANSFVDGEWVKFDTDGKLVRAADVNADKKCNVAPCWPIFQLKGSYDQQALGKAPILYDIDGLEIETSVYDDTDLAVGSSVVVGTVTISAIARAGLKKQLWGLDAGGAAGDAFVTDADSGKKFLQEEYVKAPERVVGIVAALPANTASGKLRVLLKQGQ